MKENHHNNILVKKLSKIMETKQHLSSNPSTIP